MLKALLFDFDGVLADTEPLHFRVFQHVLGEEGLSLSEPEYYAQYVGLDDRGCFQTVLLDRGRSASPDMVRRLIDRKATLFLTQLKTDLIIYPGIVEFVNRVAAEHRLAIVSGALRHEIEYCLDEAGIRKQFEHITAAQDVRTGKPHPEGYLHALHHLNQKTPVSASECLVIEDTIPGIHAAHAAGMRCLAVSTTFPASDLSIADAVTPTLNGYDLAVLKRRLWNSPA